MSPFLIVPIASAAISPMQSPTKATGRPMTSATASATGRSEFASSGPPFGRPKCASRMTLPPLSAISFDRLRDALDPRLVRDPAVFGRDVEVDAKEHALARDIGVVEGAERIAHGSRLPSFPRFQPLPLCHARESGHPVARARLRLPAFAGVTSWPQISLAIATAVSAIRFEKPHSLSYQDRTRTNLPSITLVWSRWKIEERLSWLKSLETFGCSV